MGIHISLECQFRERFPEQTPYRVAGYTSVAMKKLRSLIGGGLATNDCWVNVFEGNTSVGLMYVIAKE